MNYFKLQLQIFSIALIGMCIGVPTAFAEDTGLIDVDFHGYTPLFSELNILPGDAVTRQVTVENLSSKKQDVYVQFIDSFQTKGLGDVFFMTISSGGTTYVDEKSLTSLFGGTQWPLTDNLSRNGDTTYDVTIAFIPEAGNEYQEGTLGFDFCVGFSGGPFGCDEEEEDEDDDDHHCGYHGNDWDDDDNVHCGCNHGGYDHDGYDRNGRDRNGYDHNGYDRKGYDHDGYDKNGYDHDGYDRNGKDRKGNKKKNKSNNGNRNDNDDNDTQHSKNSKDCWNTKNYVTFGYLHNNNPFQKKSNNKKISHR